MVRRSGLKVRDLYPSWVVYTSCPYIDEACWEFPAVGDGYSMLLSHY